MTADALRRLPKVQLHCHLEGTLRETTFRTLVRKYGFEGPRANAARPYGFETFGEFLLLFAEICKVLREPDDFARLAGEYVEDALAQGVAYAEIFISPSVWTYFHRSLDVRAVVRAIRERLDTLGAPAGVRVALICDVTRNFGSDRATETARDAIALADLGVIGIGLGGDEAAYPPALFVDAFRVAKEAGLHAVAHAGEAAGPASVRDALDLLGVERIGHGVRAIEDGALVARLAAQRIPLEICPTSNRLTGAVGAGRAHPLAELERRGVVCAIDADDPALFGATLCEEYALAEELAGCGASLRFARNAVEASFAEPALKDDLRRRLAAFAAGRHDG
ncbi:MAG: adenosine deaminase [Candidatus Baltobacteraceae bacterium]